jgi:NodT family efflux transporter outer membrane factor (OMF) lipoprotein
MHVLTRVAALAAAVGLAGCEVGPSYRAPAPDVPASFAGASEGSPSAQPAKPPPAAPGDWWESFGDAELTSLVTRALRANLDLKVALFRLQEAQEAESVVLGSALPAGGLSGAAGRGTGSDLTRSHMAPALAAADDRSGQQITQAIGFDAEWELDLFGRYRRELEAVQADSAAAAAARDGVLVTVVADVARAYFDLRGLEMRLAVLDRDIATAQEMVDFVSARFERGLTNELDLTLAKRELTTLESKRAPLAAEADAARATIAVLIGTYPETVSAELAKPGLIPSLPERVDAGLPIDLLRRRPDVVEAERQLAGASARIGVATADLFPHVGASAGSGWQELGCPRLDLVLRPLGRLAAAGFRHARREGRNRRLARP